MLKKITILIILLIITFYTIDITYSRYVYNDNKTGEILVHDTSYCLVNNITKLSDCMLVMENYSSNVETAKKYIESKGEISTSVIAPTINYREVSEEKSETTGIISTSSHFTLGKGYSFNASTGIFSLTDYKNDVLSDDYIDYYTCGSTSETYRECAEIYQIKDYEVQEKSNSTRYIVTKAIVHTYNEVDSFDSEVGLYATNDENGTTYFYRGNVSNNYVSFAGYIWKIVRRNGDGSVRLIYSGTTTSDFGTATQIGTSAFNTKKHDPTYVGYKYNENFALTIGTENLNYTSFTQSSKYYFGDNYTFDETTKKFKITGNTIVGTWKDNYTNIIENYPYTCVKTSSSSSCDFILKAVDYVNASTMKVNYISYSSTSYEDTLKNEEDSTIKTIIDTWYQNNLLNKQDSSGKKYSDYLQDTTFCNDRSLYIGNGYKMTTTQYGPYGRIAKTKEATLLCTQDSDRFSVANGNLTYPISLLTIDEAVLAGGIYNAINKHHYLYSGYAFWTMSPGYFNTSYGRSGVWRMTDTGNLSTNSVANIQGVRPVINIKPDVEIITGTGTPEDPYVITK